MYPTTHLGLLADELETRFVGGEPYFDALDASLRQPHWYEVIIARYLDEFGAQPRLALSGAFGRGLRRWLNTSPWGLRIPVPLVLAGGLRKGCLAPLRADLSGQAFVFADDSYYLGRTQRQVAAAITAAGGTMLRPSLILYDGSWVQQPSVTSYYRYHQ